MAAAALLQLDDHDDPNLPSVATVEALHARLAELSAPLLASDAPTSFFRQLTFSGENPNPTFTPNRFKPDMGEDGRKITSYYRYAVKSELHAQAAVESACSSTPSCVVAADSACGAVFQGGFMAVGNVAFLRKNRVRLIVNTARGLGDFFPKFRGMVERARRECDNLEVLELGWLDDEAQELSAADLTRAVRAIHSARRGGGSVLVHCAQGRSRSGAVSVAFVATQSLLQMEATVESLIVRSSLDSVVDQALRTVQRGRSQAQPNQNFMAQLRKHERDGLFAALRDDLMPARPAAAPPTSVRPANAADAAATAAAPAPAPPPASPGATGTVLQAKTEEKAAGAAAAAAEGEEGD